MKLKQGWEGVERNDKTEIYVIDHGFQAALERK